MIDKLGVRVVDCQLGCFKLEKTDHLGEEAEPAAPEVEARVTALSEADQLTCANVFALAGELDVQPRAVADVANARGFKLRQCQLGCF